MATQASRSWNDYDRGRRLETGDRCGVDLVLAAYFYRRAAFRGLAEAQHALAFLYATGQGVPRDEAMAVRWFEAAAGQGHAPAQHNLGVMYAEGRGVPRDEESAVRWFYRAALGGSEEARRWLDSDTEDRAVGK